MGIGLSSFGMRKEEEERGMPTTGCFYTFASFRWEHTSYGPPHDTRSLENFIQNSQSTPRHSIATFKPYVVLHTERSHIILGKPGSYSADTRVFWAATESADEPEELHISPVSASRDMKKKPISDRFASGFACGAFMTSRLEDDA